MKAEKIQLETRNGHNVRFFVGQLVIVEIDHPTYGRIDGVVYGYQDDGVEAKFLVGRHIVPVQIEITPEEWNGIQKAHCQWMLKLAESEEQRRVKGRERAEAECLLDYEGVELKATCDIQGQ